MAEYQLEWRIDGPERVVRLAESRRLSVKEVPLKTLPHVRHWHLRVPGQPGTVEITWDPTAERFTLEVRKGREGKWTQPAIANLVEVLSA